MSQERLFPAYVRRDEEELVRRETDLVRADGTSRAVLLYGPGGIGKTHLVRALAQFAKGDPTLAFLDPIDVDDPDFWLLSNLERRVAQQVDPDGRYFGQYFEYLARLPGYTHPPVGLETVVSHLGRIKRVFGECYSRFAEDTGKTIVMVLDTVEAIRDVHLVYTLTQWMKPLPRTLFVLSGRPAAAGGLRPDPIKRELADPLRGMPVTTINLGPFGWESALAYLDSSLVAAGLTSSEKAKLALLTQGHPLWLAFTVAYVNAKGIPREAEAELAEIERFLPYGDVLTPEGRRTHEAYKRRLVTPYRESDFEHEAIKRLAVVRQSVDREIWQRLMSDRPLAAGLSDIGEAWEQLLDTPWIRARMNHRYITLHDAVAEELALRIIPVHDQDQRWRKELWRRAAAIYGDLSEGPAAALAVKLAGLDESLQRLDDRLRLTAEGSAPSPEQLAEEGRFIEEVARLDARKNELDQLRAIKVHYDLLSDFETGARQFQDWFEQADRERDVMLQGRLALEMQRFLPSDFHQYPLEDVVGGVVADFRDWLSTAGRDYYYRIAMDVADHLIKHEQPQAAEELLNDLPEYTADRLQRRRLNNLKGNAYMRIPGRVGDALKYFEMALAEASGLTSGDRHKYMADAYKELGFYYRQLGKWQQADQAYQNAHEMISESLAAGGSDETRSELASILTNWAYIKGVAGQYRDGSNLVESAIKIRQRLGLRREEGISWSVCGEVYRYERRFQKAWEAFGMAEQIFNGQRSWPWLGTLYQEQAICLFQAAEDGVSLIPGRDAEEARRRAVLALDICRDQSVRDYPSALNRAGRIFGRDDFATGLGYLADGIEWSRRLSDGWRLLTNLVDYAELSYRAWIATGEQDHRDEIEDREPEIDAAMSEYEFTDLIGRWSLLRGHLWIHDFLTDRDESRLGGALENYRQGFASLARGYVGSSGAAVVSSEFEKFERLFSELPPEVKDEWQGELRRAWSGLERGSTMLLARLEQFY